MKNNLFTKDSVMITKNMLVKPNLKQIWHGFVLFLVLFVALGVGFLLFLALANASMTSVCQAWAGLREC